MKAHSAWSNFFFAPGSRYAYLAAREKATLVTETGSTATGVQCTAAT